jgi:hypothetical protein
MHQAIRSFFKKHLALNIFCLAVLFILIDGLYSFCSKPKTVNCPAFDDTNFDSWFPYQSPQKLYFSSSRNKHDTITIGSVTKSPSHQGTAGSCDMNAQITSQEGGTTTNKLYINYTKFSGTNNLNLVLYDFQINGSLTETSYTPPSFGTEKSELLTNAVINGKTFANVVQIQLDTTIMKQQSIYKIWLSKQTGLVGYERYPTLEQFVKK